jgi:PAS domain S-box-containing protein
LSVAVKRQADAKKTSRRAAAENTDESNAAFNVIDHKGSPIPFNENKEKYRFIVENSRDIIFVLNPSWEFVYISPSVTALLGYENAALLGEKCTIAVHPDDLAKAMSTMKRSAERREQCPGQEYRMRHACGDWRWFYITGTVIYDRDGKFANFTGIATDITERKQAEKALHESEERWQFALEGAGDGLWDWNPVTGQVYFSSQWKSMLGYNEDEISAMVEEWEKRIHPDDRESTLAAVKMHLEGKTPFYQNAHRLLCKNGNYKWILDRGKVIKRNEAGEPLRVIGTHTDITRQKLTEQALQQSEEKFRLLIEKSITGVYILQDSVMAYVNPSVARIFGYRQDEMVGRLAVKDIVHPDDVQLIVDRMNERLTGQQARDDVVFRGVKKDGSMIYLDVFGIPIEFQGRPAVMGTLIDVTDRELAAKQLVQSKKLLESVTQGIADEITLLSDDYRILWANKAALNKFSGGNPETILGHYCYEIMRGQKEPCGSMAGDVPCILCQAREQNGPVSSSHTSRGAGADGRTVELAVYPIAGQNDGTVQFIHVSRDISERKQLEEERQRVAKLESIGVLAGGIAHDFNNILTAILGNISLARMESAPGSEINERLEEAEKATLRARDLTQQLLVFSKGGAPVKKLASLPELLTDTANFALRGSNVNCRFSIADDLWHVEIDEGQISQVIHNLVINAQQAMPTGGTIELRAENMALTDRQSLGKSMPLKKGMYIRISIQDRGIGIPEKHMDKIFDPFFTTKQKGNGLGLATSFSIIRNHQGHISVESKIGNGSTFYVYLPASGIRASRPRDREKETKAAEGAKILIMDDEAMVRDVAVLILKHIGYEDVEVAMDGAQAIDHYREAMTKGKPFDAVILDITVPGGMGGKETIKKLLEIDPGVKAIVSSGYASGLDIAAYRKYGFKGAVAKPYTMEQMKKALQGLIG